MAIIQVTSREFREKLASLFDLADKGERVIIKRGKKKAYTLVPIEDEDLLLSVEAEKRIELSREQYRNGDVTVFKTWEEAVNHLESL